jgi:hypothetical protein
MSHSNIQRQRGGTLLGFVLGLVIGLTVALGVAMYVTKVPMPFSNKNQTRSADQDAVEAQKNKDWNPNGALQSKPTTPEVPPDAAATPNAGGAATLNLGTTSANAVSISRTGITTTVNGALTVTQNVTASANLTVGSGAGVGLFTNNGANLNSTLQIADIAAGGSIGTAGTTVDIYTSIAVLQTTSGRTLNIPNPSIGTMDTFIAVM